MPEMRYIPVEGIVERIEPMTNECCQQMVSLRTNDGINRFVVSPDTFVINNVRLREGIQVTAFYDATLPVPLIYPPQYRAQVIGRRHGNETIAFDYFDADLVGSENSLKLNIARTTEVLTANGQAYTCPLGEQYLIVFYTVTTRSIPPQTTPRKVIVLC